MVIKCTSCGQISIVNSGVYGSPLFRCTTCGKLFYEAKIREPALSPPPPAKNENTSSSSFSYFVEHYACLILGVLFTVFGFISLLTGDSEHLFFLIVGPLLLLAYVFITLSNYKNKEKSNAHYSTLLTASHQRLALLSYQEQLIYACRGNPIIVNNLRSYNAYYHPNFKLDLESIQHKYDLNRTAKNYIPQTNPTISAPRNATVSTNNTTKQSATFKLFCHNCGKELFIDSLFCHRCGTKVLNK